MTNTIKNKYVAFCDILGFSNSVLNDFEQTLYIYRELKDSVKNVIGDDVVSVRVYSDSIIIIGDDLYPVINTARTACWLCLLKDLIIRGGIAYGKYWEEKDGENFYIVSEGLIKAVQIEKSIKHPIIAISEEIELNYRYWLGRFRNDTNVRPIINTALLYYNNIALVNPVNAYWFNSAIMRLAELAVKFPNHSEKYHWLQDLISSIDNDDLLIPNDVYDFMLKERIVVKKEESSD